MSLIKLNQDITYWTSAGSDKYGALSYASPVTVQGKWIRQDGLITDLPGDDQKTEFIIYSKTLIPKRSMVLLGTSVSATPITGSREIMDLIVNTSLTTTYWHVG